MFLFYIVLVSENVYKNCALMMFLPVFHGKTGRYDGRSQHPETKCGGISVPIRFSFFFQNNLFYSNIFILMILVNFLFLFY